MSINIEYYKQSSLSFYDRTVGADLEKDDALFLNLVPKGCRILNPGCGVGRDLTYFVNRGYSLTAFDAASEMVVLATKESHTPVQCAMFQELDFQQQFDGVWANAFLMHIAMMKQEKSMKQYIQPSNQRGSFLPHISMVNSLE